MYLVKTPFWLRWLYPGLTWYKNRKEKCIYLTFDDGPIPEATPFVLETLKRFDAKATFFCIGDNIKKHPDIFRQIIQAGHQVGNHTFNHLNGWGTDDDTYIENVLWCQKLTQTPFFRPPYGKIKRSQVSNLKSQISNLNIIMWDVLSGDFDLTLNPEKCLQNVLKHAQNGSIIIFHDSLKAWKRLEYTLPRALAYWQKQGYTFAAL